MNLFKNLKHLFTADLASERARFHSRIQGLDTRIAVHLDALAKLQVKVSVLEMKLDSLSRTAVEAAEKSVHD